MLVHFRYLIDLHFKLFYKRYKQSGPDLNDLRNGARTTFSRMKNFEGILLVVFISNIIEQVVNS